METFGDWLSDQLEYRGWTQAELARRAHITQPTLSRIILGTRQVGPDAALAIARALGEDPVKVFRLTGMLPPVPESRIREFDEIAQQLAELPDGPIRDQVMAAIRALAADARRRALEEQEERERELENR